MENDRVGLTMAYRATLEAILGGQEWLDTTFPSDLELYEQAGQFLPSSLLAAMGSGSDSEGTQEKQRSVQTVALPLIEWPFPCGCKVLGDTQGCTARRAGAADPHKGRLRLRRKARHVQNSNRSCEWDALQGKIPNVANRRPKGSPNLSLLADETLEATTN